MRAYCYATVILAALVANAEAADKNHSKVEYEKCYGVSRAGKNDCAAKSGKNSCAGLAAKDSDPDQWVYVPRGLCKKLVNGSRG